MAAALEVDGIWKQYGFGTVGYGTLRHDLQSWWARMRGLDDPNAPIYQSSLSTPSGDNASRFWALEDVSFPVEPGEVLGIIGRNGAGKSTLLKILSRVTTPTRGEVRIRGRIASLLEVGTGFHPDLTGRENIYLNGAILGMTRTEIQRKFDEIVTFAGLERFIETPVKRYSSGMYVRLAFAVAAHLEPEILLVDEVLAVGDLEFQRRCLGKLEAVAGEGRTVLFVSHNLGAVSNLCSRALLLVGGKVENSGPTEDVLKSYLNLGSGAAAEAAASDREHAEAWLARARVRPATGVADSIPVDSAISFDLLIKSKKRLEGVELSLRIERQDGQRVFTTSASGAAAEFAIEEGTWEYKVEVPGSLLAPGTYYATIGIHRPNVQMIDLREQFLQFTVAETGSGMWKYHGADYGSVLVDLPWSSRRVANDAGFSESGH